MVSLGFQKDSGYHNHKYYQTERGHGIVWFLGFFFYSSTSDVLSRTGVVKCYMTNEQAPTNGSSGYVLLIQEAKVPADIILS